MNWIMRHVKALIATGSLILGASGLLFWNPILHIWSVPPVAKTYADDHRTDSSKLAIIVDHILSPGTCQDIVNGDKLIKSHDELDCQVWLQMLHKYYSSRERGILDSKFEISLLEQVTPGSSQAPDKLAYANKETDQALWDQARNLFNKNHKGEQTDATN